ncbi:FG-GAP repeat protein [Leisingera daeponensis]|uniref:FG-GAP repeat protein n=1 Tax=Leisingera daeponensis TaxID=405746 RepID=A0ABS7NM18_9RHOB|nr:integrin alpha [Leisingera daeponensis]MBY6142227.1 FG-GAP repeat protein [Leisingera daeponensis]
MSKRSMHRRATKAMLLGATAVVALIAADANAQGTEAGAVLIVSSRVLADGALELRLSDGRIEILSSDQYEIIDGNIEIPREELSALGVDEVSLDGGFFAGSGAVALGGIALASGSSEPKTDNAPGFTSGGAASVAENQTAAYTAAAADVDGDAVSYTLSGTDAALFDIDANTGAVTFKSAPDYENPSDADGDNVYDIVVTASSGGQSATQAVAVTVTNVNDNAPGFTSGGAASVAENQTAAYTAAAADADGDAVSYTLSGTDAALFDIDANTGAVTFKSAPDYENPSDADGDNVYDIVVTASSGGQSATQAVAVTVTNVNDNAPGFTSGGAASVAENQTAAYTAAAADADGDAVSYTLSGTDAALFDIDANTGAVTFKSAPDYENPSDADGDNVYDIVVTASSGGQSATQAVAVTVTNVNEPIVLSGLTAAQGFVIQGDATADQAGYSVSSAGDVNGDGFDDLIVGAYLGDDGGTNAGETYVIYGGATTTNLDLTTLTAAQGFVIQGDATDDESGYSVSSAGDVNGDGFDDLIVGAPQGDDGGSNAGEAYVIYGGATATNLDLTALTAARGFVIQGDEAGDRVGRAVSSAGDVNGDGYDDLIVGAPYGDDRGVNAGEAYVIYGGAAGANVDLTTLAAAQGFVIQGDEAGDRAGYSVSSAGDVNGDGFDDLIVGAPSGHDGGLLAGEAYVIFGGATGADVDLTTLTAAQGFVIQGDAAYDEAGLSVSSAGDMNGDGFDDLIIGAHYGDDGGNNAGEAYVIYGGAAGANVDLTTLAAAQGFVIQGDEAGDRAGYSVSSAGDVNGDGFDDLIVGAPYGDDGGPIAGEAYVIYGGTTGADVDLTTLTAAQGLVIRSNATGDWAGWSVSSAGDVNRDGFDDLIVGMPYGDDGGNNAGEAYVIYGGYTGTEDTAVVTGAGTSVADNFSGNAGDDIFTDIATGDVVRGGAGDDSVTITALDFAEIDGGHGNDRLIIDGAGLSLDLTGPRTDVENFELIDLTGSGDNTLVIDKLALIDLSEDTSGGTTTFTVRGDAGDVVDLSANGGGFTANGQQTVNSVVYDVYENGYAQILVEDAVTTVTV